MNKMKKKCYKVFFKDMRYGGNPKWKDISGEVGEGWEDIKDAKMMCCILKELHKGKTKTKIIVMGE